MESDDSQLLWEIRRLRDANHTFSKTIQAVELRQKGLERRTNEMAQFIRELSKQIGSLSSAQDLADEIEARETAQRRHEWTVVEKIGAAIIGLSAISANIGAWLGH